MKTTPITAPMTKAGVDRPPPRRRYTRPIHIGREVA